MYWYCLRVPQVLIIHYIYIYKVRITSHVIPKLFRILDVGHVSYITLYVGFVDCRFYEMHGTKIIESHSRDRLF